MTERLLRASARVRPLDVALPCCSPFARDLFWVNNRTKMSFQWHRSQFLAKAWRHSSDFTKKTGLSIRLNAFFKSMVKRHRCLSSCFWNHRLASQSFLVPNRSCVGRKYRVVSSETVASKAFAVRRRRVSPTATGAHVLPFQCCE